MTVQPSSLAPTPPAAADTPPPVDRFAHGHARVNHIGPRPVVAQIDAAIKHLQNSIHELMRARAIAVQQYDEDDIEAALDDRECVVCGPGECVCGQLSALMRGPAVEVTPL